MKIHVLAGVVVSRLAWPVLPGAFRLFLALLVFVHHLSSIDWGAAAVYCFFVLSGFWIETMWSVKYRHARQPYLTYLASRVWRLAPTMVLVSLITLALLPLIGISQATIWVGNPLHLIVSTVLLLGYSWLPYLPVGSAWSLDIEMQFYIVAPLLALMLAISRRAAFALLGAAALCSVWTVLAGKIYILPCYIGFFVAGMAASRLRWHPGRRIAAVSMALTVALVVGDVLSPWRGVLIGGAHPGPLHAYAPLFNLALAVALIPFAIATVHRPGDAMDRMMGDLSFIVYLQHWVAMQWFFATTGAYMHRLAVAATGFALVLPGSWLIWRYFDRPINRMRSRWVAARLPRLAGAHQAVPVGGPAEVEIH